MLAFASGLLLLASCKKDEAKVYYAGSGLAPVLTSSATDSISLPVTDTTSNAVTFAWTNPNYQFSNGVSSINVSYYLEFDTVNTFDGPHLDQVGFTSVLSNTFTVSGINNILTNKLFLKTDVQHIIYVRIEAFIAPYTSGSPLGEPLFSNTFTYKVTPYSTPPAVTPPASGALYIVGSATPGGSSHGWDNPISNAPVSQQQFTQISNTEYKITIPLIGGGEYKFISVNGSWTNQWSVAAADTEPNGGPFVFNGANSIAPSASGTYIIDVNFQTGSFSVTPQ